MSGQLTDQLIISCPDHLTQIGQIPQSWLCYLMVGRSGACILQFSYLNLRYI